MPISMTCPGCQAKFRLADELAGKQARCQRCGQQFAVPGSAAVPLALELPAAPPAEVPAAAPTEIIFDAILVGPPPAAPRVAAAVLDDEEPPRRRPGSVRRDAPARSGLKAALLIGGVIFLLGTGAIGGVVYLAMHRAPPPPIVAVVPPPPPPIMPPPPFGVNPNRPVMPNRPPVNPAEVTTVQGMLRATDPPGQGRQPHQRYEATFAAGQTYTIDLMSNAFDPHLYLLDGAVLVAENDDAIGLNSQIRYTAPHDGKFAIEAATHNGNVGAFVLTVRHDGGKAPPVAAKTPPNVPAKVLPVVFGPDNTFRTQGMLASNDPPGANGRPHQRHALTLEAGRTYTIDLSSRAFDSYLMLVDDAHRVLSQDDDSGGNLDARITYKPLQNLQATLQVSAFDAGQGPYTLTVRRDGAPGAPGAAAGGIPVAARPLPKLALPASVARDVPLKTTPLKLPAGATARTLALPQGKLAGDIVWCNDGLGFFLLTENGTLSRIGLDDAVEQRRLDIGRRCGNLARSGAGLLVALLDLQEVWVIDPDTLDIVRRISVPGLRRVVSGVEATIAVAAVGQAERDMKTAGGLLTLDVAKGELGQRAPLPHQFLVAAPDGKHVFAMGDNRQLVRCRLDGMELTKEEEGPVIGDVNEGIGLSPDGKYVCLPTGAGNPPNLPDHPPIATYSTYVYSADNLRRPAFVLASGPYPRVVGFDPKGGHAFAQNHETTLQVYSLTGIKQHEYTLAPRGEHPREFAAHPDGNRLLLRFDDRLIDVTLPPDAAAEKK